MPGTKARIAFGIGLSVCAAIAGLAVANVYEVASEVPLKAPEHACSKGLANKRFGTTEWTVFACDDDRTLVIVAAEGNPADPFYFTVFPQGSDYHVFGEGTGNRQASDAAFAEIEQLSFLQIRALIDEAKSPGLQ